MIRYQELVYLTIGNVVAAGLYSPAAKAVIISTNKGFLMKPSTNGVETIRAYAEARSLME